jgi:hypothetical protein
MTFLGLLVTGTVPAHANPATAQTLSADIYRCVGGSPSTTEQPGGVLTATGPQAVSARPNPLAATQLPSGDYRMTATAPAGYQLTTCGQSGVTIASPSSAYEDATLAVGTSTHLAFYVTAIPADDQDSASSTMPDSTKGDDDAPPLKPAPQQVASISIVKQVCVLSAHCYYQVDSAWGPSTTVAAGATVIWRIVITNTGTADLHDITVTDADEPDCGGHVVDTLAAGASTAYSCHTADVTATMTNTATATGTPPTGPAVTSPPSSATANVNDVAPVVETTTPPAPTLGVGAEFAAAPVAAVSPAAVSSAAALAATGASHLPSMIIGGFALILAGFGLVTIGARRRRHPA